jgi:hypothetical protein
MIISWLLCLMCATLKVGTTAPLFPFSPARLCRLSRDLGAFLGGELCRPSGTPFEPAEASQRDGVWVLGWIGRGWRLLGRVELWRFADGFEENLMRELVWIAGAFSGAVKHNVLSMAMCGPKSIARNFKLTHYQMSG